VSRYVKAAMDLGASPTTANLRASYARGPFRVQFPRICAAAYTQRTAAVISWDFWVFGTLRVARPSALSHRRSWHRAPLPYATLRMASPLWGRYVQRQGEGLCLPRSPMSSSGTAGPETRRPRPLPSFWTLLPMRRDPTNQIRQGRSVLWGSS
jgi:hypothetical protein